MPVSPARAAAFDILMRVERQASFASELLHSAVYNRLSSADHGLATELVMGVLRWRARLDAEIATVSSQPLSKLDLEILTALRLALYQFRWLDRTPQRAALHESVELVKRARKTSAAPFVNAVLRKLSAKPPLGDNESASESALSPQLAANWAHPLWMVERWVHEYGIAAAQEICKFDQSIPATAIRLRTPTAENDLAAEAITLTAGALVASARRVQSGDVTKTAAFRNAAVVIQDEASQLVAELVTPADKKSSILDCCAAPGGKTLAIADRNPEGQITAMELHPHRARLMKKLLGDAPVEVLVGDARQIPGSHHFDRILADVPCSGTGTLARNPEIKWRLTPGDLTELRERQIAILCSALNRLAPGGRLIYSSCSLEREENEGVVTEVLNGSETIRVIDSQEELRRLKDAGILTWPDPESLTRGPYLRTIPGIHPCDGFFAAILEKL